MKALTLWQPWAQLMVTFRPLHLNPIKTIETRSWPAPSGLIGQRIAIHAGAKRPHDSTTVGPYRVRGYGRASIALEGPGLIEFRTSPKFQASPLPLGAVVGSGVLVACVPMVESVGGRGGEIDPTPALLLAGLNGHMWLSPEGIDVEDQRPFGIFEPGRWAWLFADLAPTTERCPACWGMGQFIEGEPRSTTFGGLRPPLVPCLACEGVGRCAPIPARGGQRVWNWRAA